MRILFQGIISLTFLSLTWSCGNADLIEGKTIIAKWQGDKQSAISITYDDGIINQFTVARPIMNELGFPATFFVITGKIEGSAQGRFIGRNKSEIIKETSYTKTNPENFFERASLIGFTGYTEGVDYHSRVGSLYESGKEEEAFVLLDEAYEKLRNNQLINSDEVIFHDNEADTVSWEQLRNYAAEGHEIASHTVTHPRLAVLNDLNMLYELEQSKADIMENLGVKYTFSAEGPYGTEDERVMDYAHDIYPALRNRMPSSYLDEINRSSQERPEDSENEYVQWQRGPLSKIDMDGMKSWVDTGIANDNIWLVLVFHGIGNLGWEPRTGEELEEYFTYMKEKEEHLWVATFGDVTKYIRERKNMKINSSLDENRLKVKVRFSLDQGVYDVPLTLKSYVPKEWTNIMLNKEQKLDLHNDDNGNYVLYDIIPKKQEIIIANQL